MATLTFLLCFCLCIGSRSAVKDYTSRWGLVPRGKEGHPVQTDHKSTLGSNCWFGARVKSQDSAATAGQEKNRLGTKEQF